MLGRPWRDARRLTVPGIARAKDGLVDLGCGTAQQWFDLCAMTGHQEWIDEESPLSITEQANEKSDELYAWVESHDRRRDPRPGNGVPDSQRAGGQRREHRRTGPFPGARVVRDQPARRVPSARPPLPDDARRGFARPPRATPRRAHRALPPKQIPGRESARLATTGNPISAGELPFSGLRVLDMTTFWAGPSCTHMLAMLGADVIHVESTRRPDGTRLIAGIPITEDQWWEKSPIFSGLNTNKRGITLDLQSAARTRIAQQVHRHCRRDRRELHPTCAGPDRAGLRCRPGHSARRDDGPDARVRPRRAVAGQPGVRLRHRGGRRASAG